MIQDVDGSVRKTELGSEDDQVGQQEVKRLQDVDLLMWCNFGQQKFDDGMTIVDIRTCANQKQSFCQRTIRKLRKFIVYQNLAHFKPITSTQL